MPDRTGARAHGIPYARCDILPAADQREPDRPVQFRKVSHGPKRRALRTIGMCGDLTPLQQANEILERDTAECWQTEAALRTSERQWRLVADSDWLRGSRYPCSLANAAYEDRFGTRPEAMTGRTVRGIVGAPRPGRSQAARIPAAEAVASEDVFQPRTPPRRGTRASFVPYHNADQRVALVMRCHRSSLHGILIVRMLNCPTVVCRGAA